MREDSAIPLYGAGSVGLPFALKHALAGLVCAPVKSAPELNNSPQDCVYAMASMESLAAVVLCENIKKISYINEQEDAVCPPYLKCINLENFPWKKYKGGSNLSLPLPPNAQ